MIRYGKWISVTLLALFLAAPADHAGRAGEIRTEAFRLLNQGVAAYKRGEYALAGEKLERSTSMALNSFRAHFYLGLARIGERRYAEALEPLEVALDLDPNHLQSLIATGDAHLKMGDTEEARAAYFRAVRLRPEYSPALDGLARVYEARTEEREAVSHFRRAINSDEGYAPAYTHLGDLYLRAGDFEAAVELLEEAVTVRPDFADGLNRLALAYGRLGLQNEAVAAVQKAIQLEPLEASHPATLGRLQLGQGSVTAAEQWFLTALELDSGLPQARRGLAEVARRRGLYTLALSQLDSALSDPRVDAMTATRLEKFREEIDAERGRLGRLQQRVDSGEALAEEYSELALIVAGRGEWENAIELQRQGADDEVQRERLAFMLFRAGRFREAHEIYAVLAGAGSSARHEVNDGVALALLGDDDAAAAAYERALALDPDHPRARLYLANAQLRLGRREAAVATYVEFLKTGIRGESAERVRRILQQISPGSVPPPHRSPLEPEKVKPTEDVAAAGGA
ncbi:MAG: tetratricopeptide repeat protein [bacterium]|nr:tetratricopeptide repeat protein [bacterium]